jgi:hypothetical protein
MAEPPPASKRLSAKDPPGCHRHDGPNPLVAAAASSAQKSGIAVTTGHLGDACRAYVTVFSNLSDRAAFVTLKYAQTLDVVSRPHGPLPWISSPRRSALAIP